MSKFWWWIWVKFALSPPAVKQISHCALVVGLMGGESKNSKAHFPSSRNRTSISIEMFILQINAALKSVVHFCQVSRPLGLPNSFGCNEEGHFFTKKLQVKGRRYHFTLIILKQFFLNAQDWTNFTWSWIDYESALWKRWVQIAQWPNSHWEESLKTQRHSSCPAIGQAFWYKCLQDIL